MDAAVQFSAHERSKILESYFSTKSVVLIQREFRREFPGRKTPCRKTITKIAEKFWNTGSVGNGNKGHGGRYVTVRTRANVQTVRKYLEQSPWKSTWRLSQEVGISRTTAQRIIHNDLKLFLYKVQIVQKQTDTNKDKGVNFVKPSVKESRTTQVILAWFCLVMKPIHLSGHVNKQNMRFWASQEPHKHTQQPLSKEKVTGWRAIGKWRIFGSYFSEDNDSNRVTVNAERYILMIRRKCVHAMRRKRDIDMNTVVFQQNGAPPRCSNRTLEYLRQYFPGDRLISRWTDNLWPPYFPDLNPPDYFLWGYLKDRVSENNPQTTEVLKDNIRKEIRRITQEMLKRVVGNFNVWGAAVIQRRGAWIEHIINY